jgi:predicted DNA-binding WGR domain protein
MRQLSFAFLEAGQHIAPDMTTPTQPVVLRRIDAARNMSRFYSLEVERDLLGSVVLARRWGRIGQSGKIRLDEHLGEREALAALRCSSRYLI